MTRLEDARLERWLGRILTLGTAVSTLLLAAGLLLELAGLAPALAGQLSRIGLIVLLATPVTRVVLSVTEYATQRDWLFLALTLTVLLMLAGSLFVG